MVIKNKNFNLRIDAKLKADTFEYAKKHDYDDASTLIRQAIKEKIYPGLRDAEFKEFLNRMMEKDPDVKRWRDQT